MKLLTSAVAVLAVAQGALANACDKQAEIQEHCASQENVKECMCQSNSVGDYWKSAIDCSDSKDDTCTMTENWRHFYLDLKYWYCRTEYYPANDFGMAYNDYYNWASWKFQQRY